jgi:hypothetical protein
MAYGRKPVAVFFLEKECIWSDLVMVEFGDLRVRRG